MKATLLMADAAQWDQAGKVHTLGLGWNVTGSPSPAMALTVLIDCPWDQTNTSHKFTIDLLDSDGSPVSFQQGPLGQPLPAVHIEGEFEVGRPPGLPHGSSLRQQLVINIAPGMPLTPGQNYEFRLTIDDEHFDSWLGTFFVRPQQAAPQPSH
ncbi:DUF6941 family protein [Nocardioides cheoyonin]|uniref:DUF6941 family protein n=1 Tax=Nocardioides cheoyonin TaxID=3156615 RepID=UPI0032B35AE6